MYKTEKSYDDLLLENEALKRACEEERLSKIVITHIAQALARDYTDLFYVNLDSAEYIDYHTDPRRALLLESRRANDFFDSCAREARLYVHPEDQDKFVRAMNRDFLLRTLAGDGSFQMTYRRIKEGRLFYVQMKVSRMTDDPRLIVIAVADIDELVQKRRAEERLLEERRTFARLQAITGNLIIVCLVDPETDSFREISASGDYSGLFGAAGDGTGFFEAVRASAPSFAAPRDLKDFLSVFTRDFILSEIDRCGLFSFRFCFVRSGSPLYVQVRAARVEEKEGPRLVFGLIDIDAQVRQEEKLGRRLIAAESQASIDALTGVKNKHAYLEAELALNGQIREQSAPPFAIVIMDLNDLKKINDTDGHQAGDEALRSACRLICDIFKRSPVFRIGGDEFAVIARGADYESLEEHCKSMQLHNEAARRFGGLVIACGSARYDSDASVSEVFARADRNMYEDKLRLKEVRLPKAHS